MKMTSLSSVNDAHLEMIWSDPPKGEFEDFNAADVNSQPAQAANHPRHRLSHSPSGQKLAIAKIFCSKGNKKTEKQFSNSRPAQFWKRNNFWRYFKSYDIFTI